MSLAYAALSRIARIEVPWTYLFFIATILAFYAAFVSGAAPSVVARAFFIWVSVFNLFAVSLFWSLKTTSSVRSRQGAVSA